MNRRTFGEDYAAGEVLQTLGDIHLRLRRPERAIEALEIARRSHHRYPDGPGHMAPINALLAQALWESGRDRDRARGLAVEARQQMEGDERMAKNLAELERWMRSKRLL